MEPIDTDAAGPPPDGARRARRGRLAAALGLAVALTATGVGVAATRGTNHAPPAPLVLSPSATAVSEAPAGSDASIGLTPYEYRLGIAAPDLGSEAPVGRAEAPRLDDARVRGVADALGLHGAITATPDGGFEVRAGAAQLTITKSAGGWNVAYAFDAGDTSPGAVAGGTGSGSIGAPGSSGSGSGGTPPNSSGVESVPPFRPGPGTPVAPPPPPSPGITAVPLPRTVAESTERGVPPVNLPGPDGAEQVARSLLERFGAIDDSWSPTTYDSGRDSVVCAPEPCAVPDHAILSSRTVEFHPKFADHEIAGISWLVEIGDKSRVLSVSGTWTTVRTLDRYPLRSVSAVFADLTNGSGWSPGPVPMAAIASDQIAPDPTAEPTVVTITGVVLGTAVMPAYDGGAVLDIVPTYVFSGTTADGTPVTQELVAVVTKDAPPVPPTAQPAGPGGDNPGITNPVGPVGTNPEAKPASTPPT